MSRTVAVTVFAMLLWALLSVASRAVLLRYGLDPWAFSFLQTCTGGLALIALSLGQGHTMASFTRGATWVMGAFRVTSAALYTTVLGWVSVLEAGTIAAMNTPVIAVVTWLLLRKRPAPFEWIGHGIILICLAAMYQGLEPDLRLPVYGLLILNAICLSGMTLIAERHPDNSSDAPGARLRFTGTVLLVTAAVFLVLRLVQTGSVGDIFDPTLLVASTLIGVLLRAPGMYFSLWSIRLAGAQSYTAAITLLPLFGMVIESFAVRAGLLEQSRFQLNTLIIALVVVVGTLGVLGARGRHLRTKKPAEP